jgi:hypothetical protein
MFKQEEIQEFADKDRRKPTINCQVFADARVLAGLQQYLGMFGLETNGKYSALGNYVFEAFYLSLVRSGKIDPVESTHEALDILSRAGFSLAQLQDKTKNRRMQNALIADRLGDSLFSALGVGEPESEQRPGIAQEEKDAFFKAEFGMSSKDFERAYKEGELSKILPPNPTSSPTPTPTPTIEPVSLSHEEEQEQARRAWQEAKAKDEDLKKFRSFRPEIVEE